MMKLFLAFALVALAMVANVQAHDELHYNITLNIDCQVSDWTEWSDCSALCGGTGSTYRSKEILVHGANNGMACSIVASDYFEEKSCNFEPCPDPALCAAEPLDILFAFQRPPFYSPALEASLAKYYDIFHQLIARDLREHATFDNSTVRLAVGVTSPVGVQFIQDFESDLGTTTGRFFNQGTNIIADTLNSLPGHFGGNWDGDLEEFASILMSGVGARSTEMVSGNGSRPDRPGARKVLVLTSFGGYNGDAIRAAARFAGIEVFVVSIGIDGTDNEDLMGNLNGRSAGLLRSLASEPVAQHYFSWGAPTTLFAPQNADLELEYKYLLASILGEDPGVCTIYGNGHISTFDGNNYEFGALGDFYLATITNTTYTSDEFRTGDARNLQADRTFRVRTANPLLSAQDLYTVQVRMLPCTDDAEAVENANTHSYRNHSGSTCARGYLLQNGFGDKVEFEWMPKVAALWISENGVTQNRMPSSRQASTLGGLLTGYAQKRACISDTWPSRESSDICYTVDQVKTPTVNENGFIVNVNFTATNVGMEIRFTSTGSIASISADPLTRGFTYGLCGFYDGCPMNDYVPRESDPLPFDASASEIYEEFGESWRVSADENNATNSFSGANYNMELWSPSYEEGEAALLDGRGTPCEGIASGQLLTSCLVDIGRIGNTSAVDAHEVLRKNCHAYCQFGQLSNPALFSSDVSPQAICSAHCSPTTLGLTNFAQILAETPADQTYYPEISIYGADLPTAYFLYNPSVSFGGKYTFQQTVTKKDFCGYNNSEVEIAAKTVTVSIGCLATPVANAGEDIHVHYGHYNFPVVELRGSVEINTTSDDFDFTSELQYWWTVKNFTAFSGHVDGDPVSQTLFQGDMMDYPNALRPHFYPGTIPGTYELELSVTDGCGVSTDTIYVTTIQRCSTPDFRVNPVENLVLKGIKRTFLGWSSVIDPGEMRFDFTFEDTDVDYNQRTRNLVDGSWETGVNNLPLGQYGQGLSSSNDQKVRLLDYDLLTFIPLRNDASAYSTVNRVREDATDKTFTYVVYEPDSDFVSDIFTESTIMTDDVIGLRANWTEDYITSAGGPYDIYNRDQNLFVTNPAASGTFYNPIDFGYFEEFSSSGAAIAGNFSLPQQWITELRKVAGEDSPIVSVAKGNAAFRLAFSNAETTFTKTVSQSNYTQGWFVNCTQTILDYESNSLSTSVQLDFASTRSSDGIFHDDLQFCAGIYEFEHTQNLRGYGETCAKSQKVYVELACGDTPVAVISCQTNKTSQYNYVDVVASSWDGVTTFFDAIELHDVSYGVSNSSEGSLYREWSIASVPAGSSWEVGDKLLGCDYSSSGCSFVPDVEGEFGLKLDISNGCETDSDEMIVSAICPRPAPSVDFVYHTVDTAKSEVANEFEVLTIRHNYVGGRGALSNWTISDNRTAHILAHEAFIADISDTDFTPSLVYQWTFDAYQNVPYAEYFNQLGGIGFMDTVNYLGAQGVGSVFTGDGLGYVGIGSDEVFFETGFGGVYDINLTISDTCKTNVSTIVVDVKCNNRFTVVQNDTLDSACDGLGSCAPVRIDLRETTWVSSDVLISDLEIDWVLIDIPETSAWVNFTMLENDNTNLFHDFTPDTDGIFVVEVFIYDGCQFVSERFEIVGTCPDSGPTFDGAVLPIAFNSSVHDDFSFVEGHDWTQASRIHARDAFGFNLTAFSAPGNGQRTYNSWVTAAPDGKIDVPTNLAFSSLSSGTYSWYVNPADTDNINDEGLWQTHTLGDYTFMHEVCDQCGFCDYAETDLTVVCRTSELATSPYPVRYSAETQADVTVTYANNKFAKVALNGAPSTWDGETFNTLRQRGQFESWNTPLNQLFENRIISPTSKEPQYTWEVISAPDNSIYHTNSLDVVYTYLETSDEQIVTVPNGDGSVAVSATQTNHTVTQSFTMTPTVFLENTLHQWESQSDLFAACFVPDVAGEFQVKFTIFDECFLSDSSVQTITAECNTAPDAVAIASEDVVQMEYNADPYTGRNFDTKLIYLNAMDSVDADGDFLTYSWSVTNDDQLVDVVLYNENSTLASAVFYQVGDYEFTVIVSDGCSSRTATVTISVVFADCVDVPFNEASVLRSYDYLSPDSAELFRLQGQDFADSMYFDGVVFTEDTVDVSNVDDYVFFTTIQNEIEYKWSLVEYSADFTEITEDPCDSDSLSSCACDPECSAREIRGESINAANGPIETTTEVEVEVAVPADVEETSTWWFGFIMTLVGILIILAIFAIYKFTQKKKKAGGEEQVTIHPDDSEVIVPPSAFEAKESV